MAMSKNGLGHRPAGSWAEIEDELELRAEAERAAAGTVSDKKDPSPNAIQGELKNG